MWLEYKECGHVRPLCRQGPLWRRRLYRWGWESHFGTKEPLGAPRLSGHQTRATRRGPRGRNPTRRGRGLVECMTASGFSREEKAEGRRRRKGEKGRGKEGEERRTNRGPISPSWGFLPDFLPSFSPPLVLPRCETPSLSGRTEPPAGGLQTHGRKARRKHGRKEGREEGRKEGRSRSH